MPGAWMRGRRAVAAAAALTVAALAIGVAAQEQGPEIPEGLQLKPVRDTTCWPCHVGWTPPLRDPFIAIEPPATTGAPVGSEFNWTVTFRMMWNPSPQVPHLLWVNPALDLSNAPSLRFVGSHADVHETYQRTISLDMQRLNERQDNVSRITVDAGVTNLTWTVTPKDAGTDLVLLVRGPASNTTMEINDKGPGEPESRPFSDEELAALGSGNWTVGAGAVPLPTGAPPPGSIPQLTRIDYTLQHDGIYDTASLRVLSDPREAYVPGGGVVLKAWPLKFSQDPAPGESVTILFDTVVWYKHNPGGPPDFALVRSNRTLELCQGGGGPALCYEPPETPTGRPSPPNGPTVTRVSEILGYASAFLLLSSIISGGMFGQASRRALNRVFDSAKRRVAYHNFLSYGLTAAALLHMVLFLVPLLPAGGAECNEAVGLCRPSEEFEWTLGLLWWGGPAMLAMFGLGVTGALQVPMIRRWSYPTWKWWHYGLTVATIVFTLLHMLIDGQNFGASGALPDPVYQALKNPFTNEPAATA